MVICFASSLAAAHFELSLINDILWELLIKDSHKTNQPEICSAWLLLEFHNHTFTVRNHNILFLAVSQNYNIEPHNEYVVVGNDVLLKCNIPSFVADFVDVVAWVDSESNSYYPSDKIGNFLDLRGTKI